MKIESVRANNHIRAFEVTAGGQRLEFPYSRADAVPTSEDPIAELFIDDELGREGFTYRLASGREDSVLWDHVLDCNEDPAYLRGLLLYDMTSKALDVIEARHVAKREIARRLGTSPTQVYRLLDTTNSRKSVDAMLDLLSVLGCEVELKVRHRRHGSGALAGASVCAEADTGR